MSSVVTGGNYARSALAPSLSIVDPSAICAEGAKRLADTLRAPQATVSFIGLLERAFDTRETTGAPLSGPVRFQFDLDHQLR